MSQLQCINKYIIDEIEDIVINPIWFLFTIITITRELFI